MLKYIENSTFYKFVVISILLICLLYVSLFGIASIIQALK